MFTSMVTVGDTSSAGTEYPLHKHWRQGMMPVFPM